MHSFYHSHLRLLIKNLQDASRRKWFFEAGIKQNHKISEPQDTANERIVKRVVNDGTKPNRPITIDKDNELRQSISPTITTIKIFPATVIVGDSYKTYKATNWANNNNNNNNNNFI